MSVFLCHLFVFLFQSPYTLSFFYLCEWPRVTTRRTLLQTRSVTPGPLGIRCRSANNDISLFRQDTNKEFFLATRLVTWVADVCSPISGDFVASTQTRYTRPGSANIAVNQRSGVAVSVWFCPTFFIHTSATFWSLKKQDQFLVNHSDESCFMFE